MSFIKGLINRRGKSAAEPPLPERGVDAPKPAARESHGAQDRGNPASYPPASYRPPSAPPSPPSYPASPDPYPPPSLAMPTPPPGRPAPPRPNIPASAAAMPPPAPPPIDTVTYYGAEPPSPAPMSTAEALAIIGRARSRASSPLAATMPSASKPSDMAKAPSAEAPPPAAIARPAPPPEPPSGRARTRLLGVQQETGLEIDPFGQPVAKAHAPVRFPTGWLLVVEGAGRGACFTLTEGVSQIGRGPDQPIRLDFGDLAVSRQGHASVVYDDESGQFYLGHGGKTNVVRLNGRPVLTTEELSSGDQIRIGETTLLFVALCGPEFSWADEAGPLEEGDGNDGATSG